MAELGTSPEQSSEAKQSANWVRAVELAKLEGSEKALVKLQGKQIALFKTPKGIRAIANRCPHEGYPLVEGTLSEQEREDGLVCLLTCNWHNWKFDLETGETLDGGDAVRTFPVELRGEEVWVELSDPPAEERVARAVASLKDSFRREEYDRVMRELARIEAAGGNLDEVVSDAILWTYDKFEWGMTHAAAAGADWLSLSQELQDPADRLICYAETLGHLNHDSLRESSYAYESGTLPWDEEAFVAAIEVEDEALALKLARGGLTEGGWEAIDRGLCRAALLHYQDFGHSAIYVEKARELAARLRDDAKQALLDILIRALVTARREDLIPEFKAYRPAREAWTGNGEKEVSPEAFYKASVAKCLEQTNAASGNVEGLYDALMQAAAWQLVHADPVFAHRVQQPISANANRLDFSHAITFANAGRRITARYPELWPDVLLQIACFLGRNSKFVNPQLDSSDWLVENPETFVENCVANIVDHGNQEFIVSAHLVKMSMAVREEIRAQPEAAWVPTIAAALNRFLNEPFKRKHTRRVAYQAMATVAAE